jgi:hypothetical protein
MQSETFRALVKPMETVHRIIRLAFIAAVPMYVCVAYALFAQSAPGVGPLLSNPLTIPLVTISVLTAVLAPYMPGLRLPEARLRQLLNQQPDTQEQRLLALVPSFYVGFIVRLAFNESIALYGFVLAFISRSFVAVLPFAIVSLALNLIVPLPVDSMLRRTASLGLQEGGMPTQPR